MSSQQQPRVIRIASRESKLAIIQVDYLISQLKETNPNLQFEKVAMTTPADRNLSQPLGQINTGAMWTEELEECLKSGRVDILVHSLKDVYTTIPDGLVLACVMKRANPCDAIAMSPNNRDHTLATLPNGSVVGTSSQRRGGQIKKHYPHLTIQDIRGNIDGRFQKLDESGKYDALCLAAAALERMGPEYLKRTSQVLTTEECLYAAAQAALAVECRAEDSHVLDTLQPLHHRDTAIRVVAERAFQKRLNGQCSEPIGVHSIINGGMLTLKGGVFSTDGKETIVDEITEDLTLAKDIEKIPTTGVQHFSSIVVGKGNNSSWFRRAEAIGRELGERVIKQGADVILEQARKEYSNGTTTNGVIPKNDA